MVFILTAIFLVFALISISSYFDTSGDQLNKIALFITSIFLISIAGFRTPGIDRDYLQYVHLLLNEERAYMEPTFKFLSYSLKSVFTNPTLPFFLIYAIIGIGIKLNAIKNLSNFWLLSVVVYFSYSFILHDLTQIRVGAALGFIMLSLPALYERNLIKFLAFVTLATMFHYSAVITSILWFITPLSINKWLYSSMIIISYLIVRYIEAAVIYVFNFFPEVFQARALNYDGDFEEILNIFNTWQLMRCGISIVLVLFADKFLAYNKYALLLIKIYVLGTSIYVLLSSNPSFAGRFSDIFFVFDILTLPLLVYLFRYQLIGKLLVIAIASTYIFMNLYYNKIIS